MFGISRVISWPKALLRRIARLPLWLSIPGGLVLLALLALAGYQGASAYRYSQSDPNFCQSCHIMQRAFEKWNTGEHKQVNCHACHELSPVAGAELILKWAILQPHEVEAKPEVPPERCEACHESGDPQWKQIGVTAGHTVHAEQQKIPCTTCHTPELHRFRPNQNVCQQCHKNTTVTHDGAAQQNCLTCHQYLHIGTEKGALLPRSTTCLECHTERQDAKFVQPKGGHAQLECAQCHKPHQTSQPVAACTSCHASVATAPQGVHSLESHQRTTCVTCHQQPHQPKLADGTTCQTCHKTLPVKAPPIPHSTAGRSQCTLCHGVGKAAPFPATHAGRTDDICLACHQGTA